MRGLNPRSLLSPPSNHVIPPAFTHASVHFLIARGRQPPAEALFLYRKVTPTCIRPRPISIVISVNLPLNLLTGTTKFAETHALPTELRPQRNGAGGTRTRDIVVPTAFVPASSFKSRSTRLPTSNVRRQAFPPRTPRSSRRPGPRSRRHSKCRLALAPASCHTAADRCIRAAHPDFAP